MLDAGREMIDHVARQLQLLQGLQRMERKGCDRGRNEIVGMHTNLDALALFHPPSSSPPLSSFSSEHLEPVDAQLKHLGDVGPGPAEVEAAQRPQTRHAGRQHQLRVAGAGEPLQPREVPHLERCGDAVRLGR